MSEELKPCPFCGNSAATVYPRTCDKDTPYNPRDRAFPIVRCGGCGAEAAGKDWKGADTAIAAWNTRAVLASIVPQGWKLVPREPTPEMVRAYLNANNAYWVRVDEAPPIIGKWRNGTPSEATAESYRAMLAASPAPDASGVKTGEPHGPVHSCKNCAHLAKDSCDDPCAGCTVRWRSGVSDRWEPALGVKTGGGTDGR